jgi:hypothetical protein
MWLEYYIRATLSENQVCVHKKKGINHRRRLLAANIKLKTSRYSFWIPTTAEDKQ